MQIATQQLPSLNIGKLANIIAINADDALLHRLTALGFRVGKPIQIIRRANFNGPFHIRLGTTDVILRPADAERIQIQLIEN